MAKIRATAFLKEVAENGYIEESHVKTIMHMVELETMVYSTDKFRALAAGKDYECYELAGEMKKISDAFESNLKKLYHKEVMNARIEDQH